MWMGRISGQELRISKKPGDSIPVQVPAGNFPEPVVDPVTASKRAFNAPAAIQTDSTETKKNPAYLVADFGAYPSCRIPLAVRR